MMIRRPNAVRKNLSLARSMQSKGVHPSMLPITNRPMRRKRSKRNLILISLIVTGWKLFAVLATIVIVRVLFRQAVRDRIQIAPKGFLIHPKVVQLQHLAYRNEDDLSRFATPDYGGLKIQFLAEENIPRAIYVNSLQWDYAWEPHAVDTNENDFDAYYAFDDDIQRNPYREYEDDFIQTTKHCRRVAWHRKLPINCNSIHEFDFLRSVQSGASKFAGEGSYRQVHLVKLDNDPPVAFKKYRWDAAYDFRDFEFMRMDAVVAEVLTPEPDIVDIFGFCALTIINEGMIGGDLEEIAYPIETERGSPVETNNKDAILHPLNNLTAAEKLVYSFEMAQALSKLHSFPGGVIVHDDIHLGQFLVDESGHLKLQDFNRAEIMLWNEKDGEYCRYRNNPGDGKFRAPEEYLDRPLNEKIDVWSLGINMYYLLTGSAVLPEAKTTTEYQERIMNGQKPPIDPRYRERSSAERTLVEIIERCWIYDPDKRIDIFEVVEILFDAVEQLKNEER